MLYWENFKKYEKDGIKYTGSFTYEDTHPSDLIDVAVDDIVRKIDEGIYYWIIVKLEASIDGVTLASPTLGGVLVKDLSELDEYLDDMEDECMHEVVGWLERNKPLLETIV